MSGSIFELFKKIEKERAPKAKITHLVAGLGNPGEQYQHTRHNAGFMALDYLEQTYRFKVNRLRFQALCGEAEIAGRGVLLIRPQTFMNHSGTAVRAAADFYKIPSSNIVIIYDDVSLPCGNIRIREKGSDGGHNGIKSILAHLGSGEFPRIRLGVGAPPSGADMVSWVLGNIPEGEREDFFSCLEKLPGALECILSGEMQKAMSLYNKKVKTDGGKPV